MHMNDNRCMSPIKMMMFTPILKSVVVDVWNVYTFVIKIDYVLRCFFFFFSLLQSTKIISIYVITKQYMSQHPRRGEEKKTHFLHFPSFFLSLLIIKTFPSVFVVQKSKSTILPFIKFDLLQENKQNHRTQHCNK